MSIRKNTLDQNEVTRGLMMNLNSMTKEDLRQAVLTVIVSTPGSA